MTPLGARDAGKSSSEEHASVCQIDQGHGMEEVVDVRGLAQVPAFPPKGVPIEVAPGPELHVNQHRERDERQRV